MKLPVVIAMSRWSEALGAEDKLLAVEPLPARGVRFSSALL